jgi:hypothetical protein
VVAFQTVGRVVPARQVGSEFERGGGSAGPQSDRRGLSMGSVIKKRRKRMAKKKHRKLLKKTRVQRRNKK